LEPADPNAPLEVAHQADTIADPSAAEPDQPARQSPREMLLEDAGSGPASTRLGAPLLLSLQAFDAAVRLGTFKAAASALRLTPSAISHRVRKLEGALGDRLFTRVHRAVLPTDAGKALAAITGRAFADLARAADAGNLGHRCHRLRLSITPSFASDWLMPRVADFMAQHPHIELAIEASTRLADFESEAIDAGIRIGSGHWPGLTAVRLLRLFATPVTSPALASKLQLRAAADLTDGPLIHMTRFSHAWPAWFKCAGVQASDLASAIWVDGFGAALQAAEQGAGLALGIEPFFADREAAGRLCRPLSPRFETSSCWLVYRQGDRDHPALMAFKRWLLAKLPCADVGPAV
jgi:DNA-binding transcriptional LysR family regulator